MMTMDQFEAEKARLTALYGATGRAASGKRAQAFARLYAATEWTQEALAEVEQMSQQRMSQWLVFGRFVLTTNGSTTIECSERHFRELWHQTDKTASEADRFAAVAAQLDAEALEPSTSAVGAMRQLATQIIDRFSDSKFHRLRDIAETVEAESGVVQGICDRIVSQGTFQTFGERRPAPPAHGAWAYRFVKGGKKKLDLMAFYAEVKPVMDEMKKVIHGHRVDFSQEAMKLAFAQLEKVIERMAR